MLKMTANTEDGRSILFLGLSDMNVEKLQQDMPIHVDTHQAPLPGPPDIVVVFHGKSEEAMTAKLLEVGILGPRTVVQTPDQGAPFDRLGEFIAVMDEELDRFLRENPEDGIDYIKQGKERWAAAFETYGLSVHDPMAVYTMLAGVELFQMNVFEAEEQAAAGEQEGPDHLDVLKIMHFVIHNGMMLAALRRDL